MKLFVTQCSPERWRKFHSEELQYLHSSSNVCGLIKSRAKHVASMKENRNANTVLVRKPEGKVHLGDLDEDGKIILKLMSEEM
jgi:hypothetical protein